MVKILPSITNISGNWKKKIIEADKIKLKEVALFLSCSERKERVEIYRALQKSGIKRIPFVHARHDMAPWEFEYLIKTWGTKAFNLHSENKYLPVFDLTEFKSKIFLENNPGQKIIESKVKKWGGLCVDFTHLEGDRLSFPAVYKHNIAVISRNCRGCAHLSAIRPQPAYDSVSKKSRHDFHILNDLSEVDYLKNYSKELLPPLMAIELENTLADQLKIKRYLKKIIKI